MSNKISFLLLCIAGVSCSLKKTATDQAIKVETFSSPSGSNSAEPFLFTDADSTVYLSWVEKNGENASLRYSSLKNEVWSEPATIASGKSWFVNWADYPMMAVRGKLLIAHFLEKNGDSGYAYDVKVTTSNDGGKNWANPALLHDDKKKAEHGFVTLLPYGDNFLITWLDGRNASMEGMEGMDGMEEHHHGSMSLRAAIVDEKGTKLNEWELDNKTCDCCQTSAAVTDSGPVVVYRDRSDEEIRDMSIVRLVNGEWTQPKSIHEDHWKIAGCPVNGPRVVADGKNLAVAWFSLATGDAQVNVIFSKDGGVTFGKPIRVDEGKAIGRVDIVMPDSESALVSWMEGSEIKCTKVHADGRKDPSFIIASTSESRSSGFPQMARSGNQIIFAWTDDQEKNIKVARISL